MSENRKADRVVTNIPIKLRRIGEQNKKTEKVTVSKNISEGGIRFKIQGFLSMACRLVLELDISYFSNPIKVISKVAWIKQTKNKDEYEVGNRFINMTKEDKDLISKYLNDVSKDKLCSDLSASS